MAKATKKPGNAAPEPNKAANENFDWSQAGVTGFEAVQRTDLGIPFLTVLQKSSPEVDPTHKDYQTKKIPGAGPGDIINTLSRAILHKFSQDPVLVVPCFYETLYVEWKPRGGGGGGGFVKTHKNANILNECTRDDENNDVHRNGNWIRTTGYWYVLVLMPDNERVPAVIGMTVSQLKKARAWLNLAQSIKFTKPDGSRYSPPLFSHSYELSSGPENNDSGSWFGWKIQIHEVLKDPILIADAIETAKKSTAGTRTALHPPSDEPSHELKDVPFA